MPNILAASDLIFTSTAATEPLLDREILEPIVCKRQSCMIFDISVPRNVHSDVNELSQVKAFNVDDLKAVVAHEPRKSSADGD